MSATIEPRARGFLVRWRGEGRRESVQLDSFTKASELKELLSNGTGWDDALATLQARDEVQVDLTISAVGQAYLRDRARRLAKTTLVFHARSLDLLNRFLGERSRGEGLPTVKQLSREVLADGWEWLLDPATGRHGRGRIPTTARRHIELWQLFWEWTHEQDAYNPLVSRPRKIDLPASPQVLPIAPTFEEVDAMIDALATGQKAREWMLRLALLARYTGGRRTELLLLPWTAVNLKAGSIRIDPTITKGGYGGRIIPIHPGLAELLHTWPRETESVVGSPDPQPIHQDNLGISLKLRRAWTRAGIDSSSWAGHPLHSLRATVRTHLVQQLIHPDIIDTLLGHKAGGTGSRHYTDRARLWPRLVEAVAVVPTYRPNHGGPARDR
jgi:integrase